MKRLITPLTFPLQTLLKTY